MGVSGQRHALATFYPWGRKDLRYPWDRRLGAPQKLEEKSFASAGDRTWITQSIARHYTDGATLAPTLILSG
jgi:hypothetical protein